MHVTTTLWYCRVTTVVLSCDHCGTVVWPHYTVTTVVLSCDHYNVTTLHVTTTLWPLWYCRVTTACDHYNVTLWYCRVTTACDHYTVTTVVPCRCDTSHVNIPGKMQDQFKWQFIVTLTVDCSKSSSRTFYHHKGKQTMKPQLTTYWLQTEQGFKDHSKKWELKWLPTSNSYI